MGKNNLYRGPQSKNEYKYIMKEVAKASILAIPCEKVPYESDILMK